MTPQPEIRIGDAEREAAVTALGEHYAAGRLTKDEYDERAEQAFAARTRSQLFPLFADLPRPQSSFAGATAAGSTGRRGQAPRGPVRHGWWFGARLMPVLVVLGVLLVLTHLPWFLLLLVAWVLFAKLTGRWSHRHHHHGGPGWGPRNRTWV